MFDRTAGESLSDGGVSGLDRVLEALAHQRRRYLLYGIAEHEHADIDRLVDAVVARERGRPPSTVPDDARSDVRTDVFHHHLPKLADLRIVEYDPRSGEARYKDPPKHFETFLELAKDIEED